MVKFGSNYNPVIYSISKVLWNNPPVDALGTTKFHFVVFSFVI